MGVCPLCFETIRVGDQLSPVFIGTTDGRFRPHRECSLREVLGGIGHHLNHELWCVERGDPDAGLSYRESARRVQTLVEHCPS